MKKMFLFTLFLIFFYFSLVVSVKIQFEIYSESTRSTPDHIAEYNIPETKPIREFMTEEGFELTRILYIMDEEEYVIENNQSLNQLGITMTDLNRVRFQVIFPAGAETNNDTTRNDGTVDLHPVAAESSSTMLSRPSVFIRKSRLNNRRFTPSFCCLLLLSLVSSPQHSAVPDPSTCYYFQEWGTCPSSKFSPVRADNTIKVSSIMTARKVGSMDETGTDRVRPIDESVTKSGSFVISEEIMPEYDDLRVRSRRADERRNRHTDKGYKYVGSRNGVDVYEKKPESKHGRQPPHSNNAQSSYRKLGKHARK